MSASTIIINAFLLLGTAYIIYRKCQIKNLQVFFIPLLLIKIAAGIGLGLIYITYYEWGDTISYFEEGNRISQLAKKDLMLYIKELIGNSSPYISIYDRQPRALLISKITSVVSLITNGNYWLSSVYFSIFTFGCLWLFAKSLAQFSSNFVAILFSLFLFPSIVFWSSGISKESLAVAAIALLSKVFIDLVCLSKRINVTQILTFLFAIILLWAIKYYYAAAILLFGISGVILFIITMKWKFFKGRYIIQGLLFSGFLALLTIIISNTKINFNFDRVVNVIVDNNMAFIEKSANEDVIHYHDLKPTYKSIIYNSPLALLSGLFRPLPGDGTGPLAWVVKIENVLIILLTLSTLVYVRNRRFSDTDRIVMFSAVGYCCFLAVFLALSAPNFGSLSRYKMGFMPILLLLLTMRNPLILKFNKWLFR